MLKRIRLWIYDLNLSQQLFSLIIIMMVFLLVYFVYFLNSTVNVFVEEHTINNLLAGQDAIIGIADDLGYEKAFSYYDNGDINNYLIDDSNNIILNDNDNTYIKDSIINNIINGKISTNYIYNITEVDDNLKLLSIYNIDVHRLYVQDLISKILNFNLVILFVILAILMLWISSVIHPLNLMKNYVNKIKNGDKSSLRIVRHDEIGVLADALVNMQKELIKQDKIKEEMIQNISHDLKTPIATIKSYSESIKDGIYPYDSLEKSVDVIYEHADRLEKKVYQLLMLNKLGYLSDIAPKGNSLQMQAVISKVLLSLKVMKPEIELIANVKDDVYFHGEEEPWRIVVENLVDNAFRYAKSKIIISIDYDELTVYNDGSQLAEDRIEKLFKPYEKGTDGNFGLGLSIVKRICDTYGYKLSGENLKDGVIFRIKR